MASLTAIAARRALNCRRALLRVNHSGAATSTDGVQTVRLSACPTSWSRGAVIDGHRGDITCRSLSTESAVSASISASSSRFAQIRQQRHHKSNNGKPIFVTYETIPSAASLAPLTEDEFNPRDIDTRIYHASKRDQEREQDRSIAPIPNRKRDERNWNYEYVRSAVDDYERHLRYIYDHMQSMKGGGGDQQPKEGEASLSDLLSNIDPSPTKCNSSAKLLSPKTLANAVRALTRARIDTPILSQRIRDIERLVGLIGWTPITENLSYRLLEANGKGGNVRRTLALLELRRRRGYPPRRLPSDGPHIEHGINPGEKEFIQAITSIQAAQLPLRRARNIYLHETSLPEEALDNPTRYLDAILLNMSQRGVPLRPEMASRMLSCYSTGRTGKAIHYFNKVIRDPIEEDGYYIPGPHPTHLGKEGLEKWKEEMRKEGMGRMLPSPSIGEDEAAGTDDEEKRGSFERKYSKTTKVRMKANSLPPFHKIPSKVRDAALAQGRDHKSSTFAGVPSATSSSSESAETKTKYEWEVDREWSLSLTAAFAFADSLSHGACGHDPIELDVDGWNCLIKACCYRGAFHRAMKILDETMPQRGIEPDTYSYNTMLAGLARVGDVALMREYLTRMTNKGVPVDKYTVQAMADGLLNLGDVSGVSTVVQDVFNQHDTLPPYTTHLKIIEYALSNGLIFEAKRHVYFVQQLWKWTPSKHHKEEFIEQMEARKHNPKLSKEALQSLFRHFQEELREEDFF